MKRINNEESLTLKNKENKEIEIVDIIEDLSATGKG